MKLLGAALGWQDETAEKATSTDIFDNVMRPLRMKRFMILRCLAIYLYTPPFIICESDFSMKATEEVQTPCGTYDSYSTAIEWISYDIFQT